MQTQTTTQSLKTFNGKYVVKKKISSGSFGVVFLGYDKVTKEDVAIKLEKDDNEEVKSLEREVEILTVLAGVPGVPKMHWSGEEQDYNILVIQLLGRDLSTHMKVLKKFSLKTVLLLANQLIPLMERVHNKGVVHRDLKPENILTGLDHEPDIIYLVDFGISKVYRDSTGQGHIPFRENKPFLGTTRYASIAAHRGYELSRKDDIESLFYVLLYFLKGQLPWQNLQVPDKDRTKAVGELKARIELTELCSGLPNEFIKIFEYLRRITFKLQPDYRYITSLINKIAELNGIEFDGQFDWSEPNKQPPRQLSSFESKASQEANQIRSSGQLQLPGSNKMIPVEKANSRVSNNIIWSINEQSGMQSLTSIEGSPQLTCWHHLTPTNHVSHPSSTNAKISDTFLTHLCQVLISIASTGSQQGTFSSMKIKYVPSILNLDGSRHLSVEQCKRSSSLSIVQEEKKEKKEKINESFASEFEPIMDENYNDEALWQRYYKIKILATNIYFKHIQKFSQSKTQQQ